jgi:hypothetical protein
MNRRSFLRGVLLSAAALALPGKGKAAAPEPAVSAELAANIGAVFDALNGFDRVAASQAYAPGVDWRGKFDADMLHLAELGEHPSWSRRCELMQECITLDWLPDGMEHPSCRCSYANLDTGGDHPYYLRLHDEA